MRKPRSFKLSRRKLAFATLIAVPLTIAVLLAGLHTTKPGQVSWILSERLKAAYLGDPSRQLDNASRAGLNTIIFAVPRTGGSLEDLKKVCGRARELGLHPFASINWLSRSYIEEGPWIRSVTKDGYIDQYAPPCPLDGAYVEAIITSQALALAQASKEVGVEGIMFDAELYGAWPTRYDNATCFCDHCFNGFLKEIGRKEEIDKSTRYAWLKDAGVLEQYYDYLKDRAVTMFRKMAKEAREYNPDLLFGVLGNSLDNWYAEAMAVGFSTSKLPFIVLDEATYRFGFSSHFGWQRENAYELPAGMTYAEYERERVKEKKLNAVWAGGVELLRWFYPVELPYHLYSLAIEGGGYWLYYLSAGTTTPRWLEAYRSANSEIDKTIRHGARPSPYDVNPNHFDPVMAVDHAQQTKRHIPFMSDTSAGNETIGLVRLNTVVLFSDQPELDIQVQPGEGPPALAALFDSEGRLLDDREIPPGSRQALRPDSLLGLSDLTSPSPVIAIINSSLPYTLSRGQASWSIVQPVTVTSDAELYWMPASNDTEFQIFCTGEGIEEAILEIVRGEEVVASMPAIDTLSFPVFVIPEPGSRVVYRILLRQVRSPTALSLRSYSPYLALRPSDVLVQG